MNNITICETQYTIEDKIDNLLSILSSIKKVQNSSLAFRSGCRSGVCGSCAVVVNGVERLACETTIKNNDIVEPLKNSKIIKDLVVDLSNQSELLQKSKAFLEQISDKMVTINDEKKIDTQSNCILCSSCYSSCPVYTINKNFLGPFALTRVYRYVNDKKENIVKNKIDSIQLNGIWDCTLCGNCNMVCPQIIDIKEDIVKLRNKSAQFGYNDIYRNNSNISFGFDPNQF